MRSMVSGRQLAARMALEHAPADGDRRQHGCELAGGRSKKDEQDCRLRAAGRRQKSAETSGCCLCCCRYCYPASECSAAPVGRQVEGKVSYCSSGSSSSQKETTRCKNEPQAKKAPRKKPSESDAPMTQQRALSKPPKRTRCKPPVSLSECAKCQLVAHWTSAQARLASVGLASERAGSKLAAVGSRGRETEEKSVADLRSHHLDGKPYGDREELELVTRRLEEEDNDDATISSLTESCNEQEVNEDDELESKRPASETWSISSCSDERAPSNMLAGARPPTLGANSRECRQRQLVATELGNDSQQSPAELKSRARRPAPPPPPPPPMPAAKKQPIKRTSQSSFGVYNDRLVEPSSSEPKQLEQERQESQKPSNRLAESEIQSIEHSLKSHCSSIYVCGCLANLYLTSTELVDNGRRSEPASTGRWQLNQTGVPVLTFDSGLARNRDRRQLSISLAERGSGFVLWSDIIDHLSNYRAYQQQPGLAKCDTFHVMYLSSNHRLMVGLSFDDALCARLFLRQVELVTSDPANIALTGPKLAAARLSKLGRLLRLPTELRTASERPKVAGGSKSRRRVDASQQQPPTTGSWSTLRRAIDRFGRARQLVEQEAQEGAGSNLLPKPLPALALLGRLQQRTPRKCDISAPCLFQHVTSVDRRGLSGLRSRILVSSGSLEEEEEDDGYLRGSTDEGVATCGEDSSSGNDCDLEPANRRLSVISGERKSAGEAAAKETDKNGSASICGARSNSTPSCYSSASHSPASSECGASRAARAGHTSAGKVRAHNQLARPTPPKIPTREPASDKSQTAEGGKQQVPDNKIQAIIRELEAQTSAELVDAKRRLMADIADQVFARANARPEAISHL